MGSPCPWMAHYDFGGLNPEMDWSHAQIMAGVNG